jgi:hypothetical protein
MKSANRKESPYFKSKDLKRGELKDSLSDIEDIQNRILFPVKRKREWSNKEEMINRLKKRMKTGNSSLSWEIHYSPGKGFRPTTREEQSKLLSPPNVTIKEVDNLSPQKAQVHTHSKITAFFPEKRSTTKCKIQEESKKKASDQPF